MWAEPLPVDILVRGFPDLPPDRPAMCHPWPERALLVDVCSERPRGGGLTWGAYLLDGPDPEQVAGRFFDPRRLGGNEVAAARQLHAGSGLGVLDRGEFLDLVFRSVYKLPMRAAFVCWDLGWVISRLARSVRIVRRGDGSEVLRFVWWTYLDGDGRERTDFYRPRIDVATAEAGRVLARLTRRKKPDPQDLIPEGRTHPKLGYVYPGRFLALSTAVYALSGAELSFPDACRAFDVPCPTFHRLAPDALSARMEALAGLYRAVMAEFALHPGAPYLTPDHALSPSSIPCSRDGSVRGPSERGPAPKGDTTGGLHRRPLHVPGRRCPDAPGPAADTSGSCPPVQDEA